MIMDRAGRQAAEVGVLEVRVAVVVTAASGYDLGYIWKNQKPAERSVGGYYLNAAIAGEPEGRWWGPGAEALGFCEGQAVERGHTSWCTGRSTRAAGRS